MTTSNAGTVPRMAAGADVDGSAGRQWSLPTMAMTDGPRHHDLIGETGHPGARQD